MGIADRLCALYALLDPVRSAHGWSGAMNRFMTNLTGKLMIGRFPRRHLAKLVGFSAFGMTAMTAKSEENKAAAPARRSGVGFPSGFVWGTATSAYQIEGAVDVDGRGRSIWDTFTRTAGKIADNSNADHAADHYHRYKDDVRLVRDVGASAYRFSIAWPRDRKAI